MKTYLLDMDGVLIESEPVFLRRVQDFLQRGGAQADIEELICCLGRADDINASFLKERYRLCRNAQGDILLHEGGHRPALSGQGTATDGRRLV